MSARQQIVEELDQLRSLPGLPPHYARLLSIVSEFAWQEGDNQHPMSFRKNVHRACKVMQEKFGPQAIPQAEHMVRATNNNVYARLILSALKRRARADARGISYTD